MLEELQLIQEMVGDLSGVGLWVLCGVLLYKLIKLSATCLILEEVNSRHKIELNEVKAAYKILKEAKGDE